MDSTSFCYWLTGFVELHGQPPTPAQWESIKEHLGLVFHKVTKPGPGQVVTFESAGATLFCHSNTDEKIISGCGISSRIQPLPPDIVSKGHVAGLSPKGFGFTPFQFNDKMLPTTIITC